MKRIVTMLALALLASGSFSQTGAYNNYDFIPGEKILFDDNFADSQDGEFPPRWSLFANQGVVNKQEGEACFVFTDCSIGNMGRIAPRIKTNSYLTKNFSVEEDFLLNEDEMVAVYFKDPEGEENRFISIEANGMVRSNYFQGESQKEYPNGEMLHGKWHHLAIAYKDGQMKVYINQHRVLVIPQIGFTPVSLLFGGSLNVKIKNVKVADGAGMNMLGKILTDGKFISHAIKFDVNKSTLKGESMGFINELAKWLKENKTVKLEVGGHTDSDGDDASNLKLSQARADAVKSQLVSAGVEAARLSAKGYGETKPIDNNTSPEGKANNRRVEFIKL